MRIGIISWCIFEHLRKHQAAQQLRLNEFCVSGGTVIPGLLCMERGKDLSVTLAAGQQEAHLGQAPIVGGRGRPWGGRNCKVSAGARSLSLLAATHLAAGKLLWLGQQKPRNPPRGSERLEEWSQSPQGLLLLGQEAGQILDKLGPNLAAVDP